MHGTRAVQTGGAVHRDGQVEPPRRAAAPPGLGNQARLRELGRPLQTKLAIGAATDPLEREADSVAARVMRMVDPVSPLGGMVSPAAPRLDRKCTECEEEGTLARKPLAAAGTPGLAPPAVHETLARPGRPLDPAARAFFEPRFGVRLDQVRVHDDAQAAGSAAEVGALAYTVGPDIAFAAGRYAPASAMGRHLLAHELAHVLQQQGQAVPAVRRVCGPEAIGAPAGCEAGDPAFVAGDIFRFQVNCDDWLNGADAGLLDVSQMYAPDSNIEIHGYASVDGPEAFNSALACTRVQKARTLLLAAGVAPARITRMVNHGASPGKAADRRSVVLRAIPAAPAPADPAKDDPAKTDPPQPDDKKPDPPKPDDPLPDVPAAAPVPDVHPRLVIQIPITPANFQVPFNGAAGVNVTPPGGARSTALDTVFQPNVAIGANYSFTPTDTGWQLGLFLQTGANAALGLGNARPTDGPNGVGGAPKSFTGLNVQGYLQVQYVVFSAKGKTISLLVQPGAGKTFLSPVPGIDGLGLTGQGGIQFTRDIIPNKLQFFGTLLIGGTKTKLDDPAVGQPAWQPWQPFFGLSIGLQPIIPVVNYPTTPDDQK